MFVGSGTRMSSKFKFHRLLIPVGRRIRIFFSIHIMIGPRVWIQFPKIVKVRSEPEFLSKPKYNRMRIKNRIRIFVRIHIMIGPWVWIQIPKIVQIRSKSELSSKPKCNRMRIKNKIRIFVRNHDWHSDPDTDSCSLEQDPELDSHQTPRCGSLSGV